MEPLEIESQADEGLLGLVTRAERAILDSTTDPVGLVRIELAPPSPEHPVVAVEASFVERGGSGVVERLNVDYAREGAPERETLLRLLRACGGVGYASVCLRSPERELADVTLHYGSRIKLFGRSTALWADGLGRDEADACRHVLEALGLKVADEGGGLGIPKRRFGVAPSLADQVEAMTRARARGLDVELYSSTLPVLQSARLALAGPADATRFLCTLSRQLPPAATSIARDALILRDVVAAELGFTFGASRWRVDNAHGQAREHRPHGPMGDGRRVQWSLNWGAKRR